MFRLVDGEELELCSSAADVVPHEVSLLMGAHVRELRTRGDGACAVHAAFSTSLNDCALHVADPRRLLRAILGHPLDVIRARVRPAEQHLLQMVLTSLWEMAVNYGAEPQANEEALFLSHLRRSTAWNRVLEAIAFHRRDRASSTCKKPVPGS